MASNVVSMLGMYGESSIYFGIYGIYGIHGNQDSHGDQSEIG